MDRDFLATFNPARDLAAFEVAWSDRAHGAVGEVHSFAPRYEASAIIAASAVGETSAKGDHAHKARAGHHLTPLVLPNGQNTFDALGLGFTLLALGEGVAAAPEFERAAAELGVPLTVVTSLEPGRASAYEADLVLIRPNQYVSWAGRSQDSTPLATLRKSVGH